MPYIGVMDRDTFWKYVGLIDREALRDEDERDAVEPLIEALVKCTIDELAAFEDHLAQVLYDLDGRIYADHSGKSGMSADGFLFTRCYVVARGRLHYEAVLADPTKMPRTSHAWCESLLFVAVQAWATITGKEETDWDHVSPVSYETGSNAAAWA